MEAEELKKRILKVLDKPMMNKDIWEKINRSVPKTELNSAIKQLRSDGMIVSRYYTSARQHMRLSTAIEILFSEIGDLKRKVGAFKK